MNRFFSIELIHEYDEGTAQHLSFIPAESNKDWIRNERLIFRNQTGRIISYTENDNSIKKEIEQLYFWVACENDSFYSYTDYPSDITFSKPYFYWMNSNTSDELSKSVISDHFNNDESRIKTLGEAPRNAIGCVAVNTTQISDYKHFTISFTTRKTFWQYRIHPHTTQKKWDFKIIDANQQWNFTQRESESDETVIFQSDHPIAFAKNASNRLSLIWSANGSLKFQPEEQLILPFANYAYKQAYKDHAELTPIYIHI